MHRDRDWTFTTIRFEVFRYYSLPVRHPSSATVVVSADVSLIITTHSLVAHASPVSQLTGGSRARASPSTAIGARPAMTPALAHAPSLWWSGDVHGRRAVAVFLRCGRGCDTDDSDNGEDEGGLDGHSVRVLTVQSLRRRPLCTFCHCALPCAAPYLPPCITSQALLAIVETDRPLRLGDRCQRLLSKYSSYGCIAYQRPARLMIRSSGLILKPSFTGW